MTGACPSAFTTGLKAAALADISVAGATSSPAFALKHTLKDADYTIEFHRGTLLQDEEKAGLEAKIEGLRRNAQVVEATPEAVLAAVKGNA